MSALAARTAVVAGYLFALAFTAPVDALAILLAAALVAVWAMPPLCRRCAGGAAGRRKAPKTS
jgi:hypothetical protein